MDERTIAVRVQRSASRPADNTTSIASAQPANASAAAGGAIFGDHSLSYGSGNCEGGGGGNGGGGAEASWGISGAGEIGAANVLPPTERTSGAAAGQEHQWRRGELGTWFDPPLTFDSNNRGPLAWTSAWGDAPDGPADAAEAHVISAPLRPATPPRMARLGVRSADGGGCGNSGDVVAGGRTIDYSNGHVSAGRGSRAGGDCGVAQDGRTVVAGNNAGRETGGAEVGGNIAKKLDFHDIFA